MVGIGRGLAAIRPLGGIKNRYVLYALRNNETQLAAQGTGTTFNSISGEVLKNHKIALAPVTEQLRIIEAIETQYSKLDKAVERLKKTQESLQVFRSSILQKAFAGELVPTEAKLSQNSIYESGSILLQNILKERRKMLQLDKLEKEANKINQHERVANPTPPDTKNLHKLPEGWVWTNLGQLKLFSIYGPRFSSDDYSTEGTAILRTTDIDKFGKVSLEKAPKIALTAAEFNKYKLINGDLLITRTGSIGTLAVFNDSVKAIPGAYLIHYRLVISDTIVWYLFNFLNSPLGQAKLIGGSGGVGRLNLNVPTIDSIPLPLPPLAEQKRILFKIEDFFLKIEKLELLLEASLKRTENLRRKILEDAFSGKLSYQNESEESTQLLLKNIAKEVSKVRSESGAKQKQSSMKQKKVKRQDLIQVLESSKTPLTPEQLFKNAGFKPEEVEEFYDELKKADSSNRILQKKQPSGEVHLTVKI